MKWLWKTIRRLFFLLRLALWLLALAAVCGYAWLHYVGVPGAVRDRLVAELARNGVAASVDRIRLELPFSLAARHVAFGDAREPDRPLLRAGRVTLSFDLSHLWRGEVPRVSSLWLEGGELSVPVDFQDPKSERIEAHGLTGRVRLKENNAIAVEQLAANLLGLRVSLQGQLGLPKPGTPPKPPPTAEERARRAKTLRDIKAELGALKCEQPPLVTVTFDADLNDLGAADATARIESGALVHPRGRLESLRARLHYEEQTLRASKIEFVLGEGAWTVEDGRYDFKQSAARAVVRGVVDPKAVAGFFSADVQARFAAWRYDQKPELACESVEFKDGVLTVGKLALAVAGGTVTLGGRYDLNAKTATITAESTADLKQLVVFMPPGWQRILAHWEWKKNPHVSFTMLRTEADPAHPTITGGVVRMDDAAYRGIVIRRAVARGELRNDVLSLTDGLVEKPDGVIQADYTCHLTTQDFLFSKVNSTVYPLSLAPMFSSNIVATIREFSFARPPTITGGQWRGNWPRADSHASAGRFESGPMSWRGVPASAMNCGFTFANNSLTLSDVKVQRPEGKVTGEYQVNFTTSDFSTKLAGTLDLAAVDPALGEGARQFLKKYHPEGPVAFDLKKIQGNWRQMDRCVATGRLQTGPLTVNGGKLAAAGAVFTLDPASIAASYLMLEVPSGKLESRATFDRVNERLAVEVNKCKVQPVEIAQVLGTNVVAAISPYRFVKDPELNDVKGLVDFKNPAATTWSAILHAPEVEWWKLRVGKLTTALNYANQQLAMTNFQAGAFYGGKIKEAWGRFDMRQQPLRYAAEFHGDNIQCGELLETLFGYKQVKGAMHGHARVEGLFGDNESIRGNGRLSLTGGHLWSVPLFGRLSKVLGDATKNKVKIINPSATEAETTFSIAQGHVYLPGAKGDEPATVKVAPHLITGTGAWRIGGDLDFIVKMRVLRGNEFIRTFTGLLEPVTGIFEDVLAAYHLTGPLSDPRWTPGLLGGLPFTGGSKPVPPPATPAEQPKR
ncbi:MAG: hypothetical protein HZA91_16550 [Verrucomicrobia bacterium]|nr:hypothetical protein [Verrucomicrobiota bacterium]